MDSYLERLRQEIEDAIGGASSSALAQEKMGEFWVDAKLYGGPGETAGHGDGVERAELGVPHRFFI